jgi:hypothetical protein
MVGIGEIAAGFVGGITSEATAVPAAIPTPWCNAPDFSKIEQRRVGQPIILFMQIVTFVRFPSLAFSRGETGTPPKNGHRP